MTTVLVVEDREDVRTVLRRSLERSGYDVLEAPDGEVALERYRDSPADLVITDLLMPRKGGLELIADLRREYPDVTVIAVSVSEKDLAEARRLGATRTLHKPFSPDKLLEVMKETLESCP